MDRLSPDQRSLVMSRIRNRDTKPERFVHRRIWSEGFRYARSRRKLPGTPDLILPRYGVVVFVHAFHLKYRMQQKGDLARDAVTSKYILGMRILMLGYEHALKSISGDDENGIREHFDRFRVMAAKAASSIVLALADYLPRIVASAPQEAE